MILPFSIKDYLMIADLILDKSVNPEYFNSRPIKGLSTNPGSLSYDYPEAGREAQSNPHIDACGFSLSFSGIPLRKHLQERSA